MHHREHEAPAPRTPIARIVPLLAALAVPLALSGCGWFEVATTREYGKCRASLVEQGLSTDAARAFCVVANEGPAKIPLKGNAVYRTAGDGVSFVGRVENPSTKDVVTGFTLKVQHPSIGKSELLRIDRVWIEPGASFDFTIPQGSLAYVPPPERRVNPGPEGSRWTWDVDEVRGIPIVP
jgi:hypothetical protein